MPWQVETRTGVCVVAVFFLICWKWSLRILGVHAQERLIVWQSSLVRWKWTYCHRMYNGFWVLSCEYTSFRLYKYVRIYAHVCVFTCVIGKIAVCMDTCLCLFLRMQASVYSNPTEDKTISFFQCLFLCVIYWHVLLYRSVDNRKSSLMSFLRKDLI